MRRLTVTLDKKAWEKVCEYRAVELLKGINLSMKEIINRMIHEYVI